MSRIGRKPVAVPKGVTVTFGNEGVLTVKGPKGELKQAIDRDITVEVKDGEVSFIALLIRSVTVHCMAYIVH